MDVRHRGGRVNWSVPLSKTQGSPARTSLSAINYQVTDPQLAAMRLVEDFLMGCHDRGVVLCDVSEKSAEPLTLPAQELILAEWARGLRFQPTLVGK